MSTVETLSAELDALGDKLRVEQTATTAGEGFSARLHAYLIERIAQYERRRFEPQWSRVRVDLARRLALVVLELGDSDPLVRLIAGRQHDPRNTAAAVSRLLNAPPDPALEALDAAQRRDHEADVLPAGANVLERTAWITRRSRADFTADVDGWLRELASAAHAAEWEAQQREIDRLTLRLQAVQPNAEAEALRTELSGARDEAAGLRFRLEQEQAACRNLEDEVVELRSELRSLAPGWAPTPRQHLALEATRVLAQAAGRTLPADDVNARIIALAGERESNRQLWEEISASIRRERGIHREPDTIRKILARHRRRHERTAA